MAPAPGAMGVDDEGAGPGSGARNQSSMVVVKSEADCTNAGPPVVDPEPVEVEDEGDGGDTTECSSSFGDTCSGFQDGAGDGEPEVNSGMSAHADGGRAWTPPRKKVTAEWRNSVRPILWRCQWLELRMRELSSQMLKYDRELALNKKQKELQAANKENGSMSESMQFHKGHGNSIMKRRKRRRHEENSDMPLYINKHQILSYYHDKQNKGAETDGVLIDEDCGTTVSNRGGLGSVTLLDSEDYGVIFEQLSLNDILLMINGVQSRVHLLQDRLSKAHSEGRNFAFSEGNIHVRVAQKKLHTQNHSSYTECRYTKPQKKKNLSALLKDDSGPALSGRTSLPDRQTDTHIKYADRIAEERSGEGEHSREKAITMDLLLGIDNSISNGYIQDFYFDDPDDVLIDNQAISDACLQFDKAKHLPSVTYFKEQNISAPVEVKNTCAPVIGDSTCAPVEVDTTCALAVEQESSVETSPSKEPVSSGSKQEPNSKKNRRKKGSLFTRKKQRKEASKAPATKEKTEGTPSASNTQTESTLSAAAKQKSEGTHSDATGLETLTACSAGKKRKSVNEPADAKEHGSGNSFSASMEQKTGKPSSAVKRQKTEKSSMAAENHGSGNSSSASKEQKTGEGSSAAKMQETEHTSAAAKQEAGSASSAKKKQATENPFSKTKNEETASTPLKLQVEKALLVAVDSRRSQRVRKPKVFSE